MAFISWTAIAAISAIVRTHLQIDCDLIETNIGDQTCSQPQQLFLYFSLLFSNK